MSITYLSILNELLPTWCRYGPPRGWQDRHCFASNRLDPAFNYKREDWLCRQVRGEEFEVVVLRILKDPLGLHTHKCRNKALEHVLL